MLRLLRIATTIINIENNNLGREREKVEPFFVWLGRERDKKLSMFDPCFVWLLGFQQKN